MSLIPFFKYQGTGNDFILIDNRDRKVSPSVELAQKLCDRKFGIGSDGLILIQNDDDSDFEIVFYNPDGSQSLCGNGSRCAVNFASKLGIFGDKTTFKAYDGEHQATILDNGEVRLKMNDVQNVSTLADGTFVDTGSPHLMVFTSHVNECDVIHQGKAIRNSTPFKEKGVNVNFVELIGNQTIYVRTYERGVENETLSCGTGVTAAAIASNGKGVKSPVEVHTKGGTLVVEFIPIDNHNYSEIYLTGPAKEVFEGTIDID
jgi:diaminopimelate epimerase